MMAEQELSVSGLSSAGRTASGRSGPLGRAAGRGTARGAVKTAKRAGRRRPAGSGPRRSRSGRASAFRAAARTSPAWRGSLSVIISARNEEETLPKLLEQVMRLRPLEIIVVLNGCSDRSFQRTRLCPQATVVCLPEPAGHDVGRSLGAKLSRGELLLFLDGDMVIPAGQLTPFVAAVDRGVDVALNDLDPLLPPFGLSDAVTRCKLYLNQVLGRPDLGASSMTAVPHALSRQALESIGYRELMVPPKALALAVLGGLRVEKAGGVNVIKQNRLRQGNTGAGNAIERLIAGDHAEALAWVIAQQHSGGTLTAEHLQEHRRQIAAWRNAL